MNEWRHRLTHVLSPSQIRSRCDGVLDRRDKVKHASRLRGERLEDARNYQQFLRNIYEVLGWINNKHQVAADDSYRDPVNLQVCINGEVW